MREVTPPPLRTLFALRQFAAFSGVGLAELAVVADNVRETQFAAGTEIAAAAAHLSALHLVIEGQIETRFGDRVAHWGPREVFGLLEVLAGRPVPTRVISLVDTRTLELRASDALELLEDNLGVLHAVLHALIPRLLAVGGQLSDAIAMPGSEELSLVDRLILLRQLAPFAGGGLHALAAIAQSCEQLLLPAGTVLARADQRPDHFAIVLDSGVQFSRGEVLPPLILRAGAAAGLLEAIGGVAHTSDLVATNPTRILRCPTAALLDVLEDHSELGLTIIHNVATHLLDLGVVERDLHDHLS